MPRNFLKPSSTTRDDKEPIGFFAIHAFSCGKRAPKTLLGTLGSFFDKRKRQRAEGKGPRAKRKEQRAKAVPSPKSKSEGRGAEGKEPRAEIRGRRARRRRLSQVSGRRSQGQRRGAKRKEASIPLVKGPKSKVEGWGPEGKERRAKRAEAKANALERAVEIGDSAAEFAAPDRQRLDLLAGHEFQRLK